ncbi:hypothetical protein M0804_013055 [Polistes exclamans]|nr:hypothetical protein M0804_013055 [Polistes exclamans]
MREVDNYGSSSTDVAEEEADDSLCKSADPDGLWRTGGSKIIDAFIGLLQTIRSIPIVNNVVRPKKDDRVRLKSKPRKRENFSFQGYHSGHQSRLGGYNTASSSGPSSLPSGPWASGYGPAPQYLQHREFRQQQRHPYPHQQPQIRNGNNYQSSQNNYHGYQQRNGNSDRYGGNSGGNSGWRR